MTIDLHMHSTASDGTLSPTELMRFAAECGCNTVALTDHDTAAGVSEARSEAHRLGIRFIAGIEVSSLWGGRSIHVVGLGIDDTNPVLTRKVREFEVSRTRRAAQIAEKLAALGIAGMLEKATAFAENKLDVSRVHFALALLEAGAVKNQQEAFDRYLGDGKPAYIMAPWPTVAEAVDLIHTAGGIAVMAHPGRYHFKNDWTVDELMKDFAAAGGEAVEVISGSQQPDFTPRCLAWAGEYKLLVSTGSDFHSKTGTRPMPGTQGQLPAGYTSVLSKLTN
ncbi:PHP domain-containing protein [Duodenibacillus massiliensis]|uniref:PHP domain-containing protein n=1 Tax=Duodenibacillus massiliensis TaxID=1852381 RepID=UPI003078348A